MSLDLPTLASDDRLRSVLTQTLSAHAVATAPGPAGAYWSADFLGLDRSARFRALERSAQERVVSHVSDALLQEALHIETMGVAFSSRMALLATSVEERMLYGFFAAEEATHLAGVSRFAERRPAEGPFLAMLDALIADGDRATLVLVVQVVLEGWGLDHYRGLARACREPALAGVLDAIVRDEARHHGSGVLLAPRLNAGDAAVEVMTRFCGMVQAGPQGLLDAMAREIGPLSRAERVTLLEELDTEAHAGRRLALVRDLLSKVGADDVIAALEARGCFQPLSAEDAA